MIKCCLKQSVDQLVDQNIKMHFIIWFKKVQVGVKLKEIKNNLLFFAIGFIDLGIWNFRFFKKYKQLVSII